ncbi:MAG: phosphodiester glycosidase family protein, partial [Oscillospiraceae bacterium]|nr:phosphodiester glycosidase family protein [Oscillospiraceae bacterium]
MSNELRKKKKKNRIRRAFKYVGFTFGSLLAALLAAFFTLLYGPFTQLRDLYAITMMETSAAKFMATAFLSKETIADIYRRNATLSGDEKTDPSLVQIIATSASTETTFESVPGVTEPGELLPAQTSGQHQTTAGSGEGGSETEPPRPVMPDELYAGHPDAMHETDGLDGIQLVKVSGPTFTGYMLVVSDPSRVSLCVSSSILNGAANGGSWWTYTAGQQLMTMVNNENAVAAINGGAFYDPEGTGNGGRPDGVLIHEGKILYWGPEALGESNWQSRKVNVIGINFDNILVLGQYTKAETEALNLRDAVSFDNPDPPFLVVNGRQSEVVGTGGSGIQPRTCIGQRADGAFLFLVIDGRGAGGSLGATQKEATNLLLNFGAVNAANLDGG